MTVKGVTIKLPGYPDGMNSAEPAVTVGSAYQQGAKLQASESIDAILKGSSIKRRPGMKGICYALPLGMKGLDCFLHTDGTEDLLTVAAGKLYSIDKAVGTATEIYDLGGTGEAWMAVTHNKAFVSNGQKNIKVEGNTGYQLAIDAPTTAAAAAASSGNMTAGVYTVYACYVREVDGVIRLYSTGQALGAITVNGSQKISVTFPDSTDPQVTAKVIFCSVADGSTYYYTKKINQGTLSTEIDAADITGQNQSIIYDVVAADNTVPPAFSQILAADNRLWGVYGTYLYYSLSIHGGNVYDLERWGQLNYIEYPYKIISIHALGENLYINTTAGLICQPSFDPTAQWQHVEKRYHFKYPRTVAEWSGTLIGLTEDGVRIFDGAKMSAYDVSLDVKTDIDKAYAGASGDDHKPCGTVHRRTFRTEYHLGYRDLSIGIGPNNRRLVLNLDRFAIGADGHPTAAWERWNAGANYLTVDADGIIYAGQNGLESASTVYIEDTLRCADTHIYLGDTLTTEAVPALKVTTGVFVMSLSGKVRWTDIRLLAQLAADMSVEAHILAYPSQQTTQTVEPLTAAESVARFGVARFGVDRFAPATPTHKIAKLPRNIMGYAVYFVINQTEEDKNFEILQMEATGVLTASRFT